MRNASDGGMFVETRTVPAQGEPVSVRVTARGDGPAPACLYMWSTPPDGPAAGATTGSAMPVEIGDAQPQRDWWRAILSGLRMRCPSCGEGRLFGRYLKVRDVCPGCSETLHHHRADDAPAYFTILIVGHVVVGAILPVERAFAPPLWLHAALWLPLTLVMALALLPCIKGSIVGLQWALYMHGFGGTADTPEQP